MRRILTAIVLIPAVIYLVLWGNSYLLIAVQIAITELGLWEYFRLAEAGRVHVVRFAGYAFGGAVVAAAAANSISVCVLGAVLLYLLLLLTWAMVSGRDLAEYLGTVSSSFLGVFYVAVPLSLLTWVCLRPRGRPLALLGLVLVWTGDTMAYFVGKTWGRHKLAPRISPGKTWEGTIASLASAVLAAMLYVRFYWNEAGLLEAAVLAVVLNVAAQTGDLAESAFKRGAGVKDSSQLVPGHGGVLDRIDALLFAAPVLWYYWQWKAS